MLKPNLLAELSFIDYKADDVIFIPVKLIQEEISGEKYLYLVNQEDTVARAKKIYISTTESNGSEIIISEGLSGGETIINDGYRTVTDGRRLDIQTIENSEDGE